MIFYSKPQLSTYTVPVALPDGASVTVVHISDLHSDFIGNYTEDAAALITAAHPDVLVATGDLVDCRYDRIGTLFARLLELIPPMPVIISPGNHEKRIELSRGLPEFRETCARYGVISLDNAQTVLTVHGHGLRFFGYIQPFTSFDPHSRIDAECALLRQDITVDDVTAALGPCPDDAPVILLAHDPAPFAAYAGWGAPLTLSGHIHGGGIRLPLLGGLLSPARRFFPRYCAGLYTQGTHRMIVSRGLCASPYPRIGNPPEVAVITLVGEGAPA